MVEKRDIGLAGAFSIGIGGIVGGGIFAQILGQPEHAHALWVILGLAVFPFVYEGVYRAATGSTH